MHTYAYTYVHAYTRVRIYFCIRARSIYTYTYAYTYLHLQWIQNTAKISFMTASACLDHPFGALLSRLNWVCSDQSSGFNSYSASQCDGQKINSIATPNSFNPPC